MTPKAINRSRDSRFGSHFPNQSITNTFLRNACDTDVLDLSKNTSNLVRSPITAYKSRTEKKMRKSKKKSKKKKYGILEDLVTEALEESSSEEEDDSDLLYSPSPESSDHFIKKRSKIRKSQIKAIIEFQIKLKTVQDIPEMSLNNAFIDNPELEQETLMIEEIELEAMLEESKNRKRDEKSFKFSKTGLYRQADSRKSIHIKRRSITLEPIREASVASNATSNEISLSIGEKTAVIEQGVYRMNTDFKKIMNIRSTPRHGAYQNRGVTMTLRSIVEMDVLESIDSISKVTNVYLEKKRRRGRKKTTIILDSKNRKNGSFQTMAFSGARKSKVFNYKSHKKVRVSKKVFV